MNAERFSMEPIIGSDRNHWQVIELTCGLDIVRCETFDKKWAEFFRDAGNLKSLRDSQESNSEERR